MPNNNFIVTADTTKNTNAPNKPVNTTPKANLVLKNKLHLSVLVALFGYTMPAFADETTPTTLPEAQLATVTAEITNAPITSLAFANNQKASDTTIDKQKLQQRSSTLGNALSGELGVHSNPFGGGASAPVVRGQEGVRVKVLNNSLGVADMSTISPDHAVAVDTLLASRVELVRGASTLMHANASPAGVVNVIDERIPSYLPYELSGETLLRYNTGSSEKLATAALLFPVGDNLAMRVETLHRDAKPYNVPAIDFGQILHYLPDSYNKTRVNTVGLSYIGDKGYIGFSHGYRRENYGLVGHNHKYDACQAHILEPNLKLGRGRYYLLAYPNLMDDSDMIDGMHFHCGNDHDNDPAHSHSNVYGHKHDPSQKGPWLEMYSVTTNVQARVNQPTTHIDEIRADFNISDYKHIELDEGKEFMSGGRIEFSKGNAVNFSNKARLGKLSVHHTLNDNSKLVWGVDYQKNRTHALIDAINERSNRRPLVANTQTTLGLFALANYQKDNLTIETGYRHENTQIPVHYDIKEINDIIAHYSNLQKQERPDLSTYKNRAHSYALSALWDINDKLRLDATYSHNERIPTPMELYYHGKHLATNSFMFGNKDLDKEKSNNYEIGTNYKDDKWHIKGSVYANNFDNYIHPENLYKIGNLAMRRFIQSKAKLRGTEFEIGYQFNPTYKISMFGDMVRGKLYDFAPIFVENIYGAPKLVGYQDPKECGYNANHPDYKKECAIMERPIIGQETIKRPDRNAPRMSPDRIGFRINGEHGNISSSVEFTHVRKQDRISHSVAAKYNSECTHHTYGDKKLCPIYIDEDATSGYNLLNVGVDYHGNSARTDYTVSLRANNLLNEKIYVHNSFLPFVPQQGRNFSLSVNAKF